MIETETVCGDLCPNSFSLFMEDGSFEAEDLRHSEMEGGGLGLVLHVTLL